MPSYAQLQDEVWWGREVVTSELDWLGDSLCAATGRPRSAFGTKGDNDHLNGGHRSQEWILNSVWCTNTNYTVQSGLDSDQRRHIAAADFVPGTWGTSGNLALMRAQTGRLWMAAVQGKLPGVTQVLGTLDGVTPIGLNVGSGSTYRPDSSHLHHWHLTFDRRFMRDSDLMRKILSVVLNLQPGGRMLLIKVAGDPAVYVSDGHFRRHLTSGAALSAAQSAGHPLVEVPTLTDLEALAGPLGPPVTRVELTPEQVAQIAALVINEIVNALPTSATVTGDLQLQFPE